MRNGGLHPLSGIESDPYLPGQPKRLFRFLAEEAGLAIGEYVIEKTVELSMAEIAIELGRERPSVYDWLKPLIARGLIAVEDEKAWGGKRPRKTGRKRFTILKTASPE